MTEQQRPDEDVEGHRRHFFEDPEGTEASEDDAEGHRLRSAQLDPEGVAEDVEGHHIRYQQSETGDDDDVEGHSPARRPL